MGLEAESRVQLGSGAHVPTISAADRDRLTALYGPLGALRGEAVVQRSAGIKMFARGHLSDESGVTVQAEGVFILPTWARDGAGLPEG